MKECHVYVNVCTLHLIQRREWHAFQDLFLKSEFPILSSVLTFCFLTRIHVRPNIKNFTKTQQNKQIRQRSFSNHTHSSLSQTDPYPLDSARASHAPSKAWLNYILKTGHKPLSFTTTLSSS